MTNEVSTNLATQMQEDYLAYSMAVLVGRAIPDLYDGLKPVQRRVLQTMLEEGLTPDKRYVKCARVTGLTMGYYHPHSGAYGALVNMATSWNNNVPWIDGHGNFGSTVDGPAAERYTECKLRTAATSLLLEDKATWETRANYDGSRQEAVRFNSALPTVLLNGDSGIAVGFATKLAPHNLRDVAAAAALVAKGKVDEARERLLPDFPTGCDIVQDDELKRYQQTGSGNIRCRAKVEVGTQQRPGKAKDRATLTFTHLPPGVNPEKLGEQVKNELEKGRLDGIAEVIDESDLTGDRVVVVLKPGSSAEEVKSKLYTYTDLDIKYSAKTLVIDGVKPVELAPVEVCQRWYNWRMGRLEVKFTYERDNAEARLEVVSGYLKAINVLDEVIAAIRTSATKKEAMEALVSKPFKFTPDQASAILEMRLRQLTGLDVTELEAEKTELEQKIADLSVLIEQPKQRSTWVVKQLTELGKRHGEVRRSALSDAPTTVVTKATVGAPKVAPAAKPRFMKVDTKKGVVEQVKGPRGAMVLDAKDKVILVTQDAFLRKVPATFKGAISSGPQSVVLAKREAEVKERKFLVVFTLGGQLRALTFTGEDLVRATSKGKTLLPEGSNLLYFGEGTYEVKFASARKKPVVLNLEVKAGRPGGRGVKVANLDEVKLT